jgi:magnesium transporter
MDHPPPGAPITGGTKRLDAPLPVADYPPDGVIGEFKTPPAPLPNAAPRLHPHGQAKSAHGGRPAPQMRAVSYANLTWIDVQHPSGSEIEWLHTHYPNIHTLHFVDVTSPYQQPKLDERTDYLFLVLHFPFAEPGTDLIIASEVDIFVGPGYVITAHAGQLRPLMGLFDQVRDIPATRAALMEHGSGYLLYSIMDKLVEYCFPMLNKIDQDIERIGKMIFTDNTRRSVYEISMVRRDILAFRHVIKPQFEVMTDLERRAGSLASLLGDDFSDYFANLNNRVGKIWHTVEDHKEVIEGLSDTHDSLINAHINNVIKLLTVFSVIMLPMTLITGIYGMNFDILPLRSNPEGFWVATAAMIVIAVIMVAFFKLRRWV